MKETDLEVRFSRNTQFQTASRSKFGIINLGVCGVTRAAVVSG
jgi:hypothetical protein